MVNENLLYTINIDLLEQGADILRNITDEQYQLIKTEYYRGTVGAHIRHILDHYSCLLNGWNDKVDYDARSRNKEIEKNRISAISKIEQVITRFNQILKENRSIDLVILVKSNISEGYLGSPWSSSTIKRELQFLVSHTVHHYALIALILRIQNISVPDSFGVAPSTLNYRAGNDATGMK